MKKDLYLMLEDLINDDSDGATKHLGAALSNRIKNSMVKEMGYGMRRHRMPDYEDYEYEEMDGDMDYDDRDDHDDMDYDDRGNGCAGMDHDDMDRDYDDMDSEEEMEYEEYARRRRPRRSRRMGESLDNVYVKKVHHDDSMKHDHGHSKKHARRATDHTKGKVKGNAYDDKVHKKDNSQGYDHGKSKGMGRKGLKPVVDGHPSPDSDGGKDNRRTDKTSKYHGKSREGKEV